MNGCLQKKYFSQSKNWISRIKFAETRQKNALGTSYCNIYAYTANNPVRYIDPDGRQTKDTNWWMKNWFKEAWTKAGNRQGVDLNLNPHNKEEQYYRAQSHVSSYDNNYRPYIVAAHGNESGIFTYYDYDPNSKDRGKHKFLSAIDLANQIKSDPAWEKSTKTVILYSCSVGVNRKDKNGKYISYAQELANALGEGVIVYAPNGTIVVGWVEQKNKILTESGEEGKMIRFIGRQENENW